MTYADYIKAAKLAAAEAIHHAETDAEVTGAIDLLMQAVNIEKNIIGGVSQP